jgi:hypothetical protein
MSEMVILVDKGCPIASAMGENILGRLKGGKEEEKEMPNFISAAFENAINCLPREITANFVKKVAEIAKKVIGYERYRWPWDNSGRNREWLYQGHSLEELIVLGAQVAPDQESFLIFLGVILSQDEGFSYSGSQETKRIMRDLRELLLTKIKTFEEATLVAKYAGRNGKAGILLSWFSSTESL